MSYLLVVPVFAAQISAAPAPPVPPPIPVVRSVVRSQLQQTPITVEVDASGAGERLWSGVLRVGQGSGANVSSSVSQAPPAQCVQQPYRHGQVQQRFSIQLGGGYAHEEGAGSVVSVQISWARPNGASCAEQTGSRTVEVRQQVTLEPGVAVTLEGDAGLRVRMVRRVP